MSSSSSFMAPTAVWCYGALLATDFFYKRTSSIKARNEKKEEEEDYHEEEEDDDEAAAKTKRKRRPSPTNEEEEGWQLHKAGHHGRHGPTGHWSACKTARANNSGVRSRTGK